VRQIKAPLTPFNSNAAVNLRRDYLKGMIGRYPPADMGMWRSHTPISAGGNFSITTFETAPTRDNGFLLD
jgi:hypothetical protein